MTDRPPSVSREQQALNEFGSAMAELRTGLATMPEASSAFDAMREALMRFGACELRMRRADRLLALGLRDAEAAELSASALAEHERGLAALPGVRPLAEFLTGLDPDDDALARWREASPQVRADWRDQIAQTDVGKEDARVLASLMDEWCEVVDGDGVMGLSRHMFRQLDALEDARRSDDRGTRTASFPVWKVIGVACVMGLTVFAVWVLITTRAPWWNFFLVALVACVMTLLIVMGC